MNYKKLNLNWETEAFQITVTQYFQNSFFYIYLKEI